MTTVPGTDPTTPEAAPVTPVAATTPDTDVQVPAGGPPPGAPTAATATATAPTAAPAPRAKTRGVADIVFLIDVTGSMAPVIDALRKNIEVFIDSLSAGDANNAPPVKDWRGTVVGYRDAEHDGADWLQDNPFVRDAVALKAQFAGLRAQGGADEPESPLDALSTRCTRSRRWRRRRRGRRGRTRASGATGATRRAW